MAGSGKSLSLCVCLCSVSNPMDCSLSCFFVHGVFQARIMEQVAFPSPGDLSDPGIKPYSLASSALSGSSLPAEPSEKSPLSLKILSFKCLWNDEKKVGLFERKCEIIRYLGQNSSPNCGFMTIDYI